MPVLQFKGKTAIECYHHTVPNHTLELDRKLSALGQGERPGLGRSLGSGPSFLTVFCLAGSETQK